jgi:lipopolysaccharide/colanic/teichoic acid biosynthesis glycosyltransferase
MVLFKTNDAMNMEETLQHSKKSRTYRHFSVPSVQTSVLNKKLEFFYIGKRTNVIDKLVTCFESGYAAETAEQAKSMLQNLAARSISTPDVIIAESSLGLESLSSFSQFIATHPKLNAVPLMVEGTLLSEEAIRKFATAAIAEDIVSIEELTEERLISKIRFWKKVKQEIINKKQPEGYDFSNLKEETSGFFKRSFDIVMAALLLIILSPLFLLIMLALKIESRGPVFYISKRAGKGYKIFNFYKFRTMEVEANKKISDVSHLNLYNPLQPGGPVFIKIDNDPRVTKLGSFLRRCSLDELPQLFNVFKGDMSLVGNRPLPLYEAASLTTDKWATRFLAPAGMTGLWQISRGAKYSMTAEERIKLDINYAEKSNFLYDLWIMANTPSAVIQGTKA